MIRIFFNILLVLFFSGAVFAEDSGDVKLAEGMQVIKVSESSEAYVVVPKGGRIYQDGNVYTVESADAYAARGLDELKAWIQRLEAEQKELKQEIDALRRTAK